MQTKLDLFFFNTARVIPHYFQVVYLQTTQGAVLRGLIKFTALVTHKLLLCVSCVSLTMLYAVHDS